MRHSLRPALACIIATAAMVSLTMAPQTHAKPDKEAIEKALTTLERGTRSGNFATRAMAVEALGYAPKKHATAAAAINDALSDPQWNVRRAAIEALRNTRNKTWKAAFIDALRDPKVSLELQLTPLFREIGVKETLKIVKTALKDPKFPAPERLARRFATMDGPGANGVAWLVPAYTMGLKLSKGPGRDAFQAELAGLPLPAAAPIYKKLFKKFPAATKTAIVERLATMKPAGMNKSKLDLTFIKVLLKSKDEALAFRTAVVLAGHGDSAGKKILLAAAQGADEARKMEALRALGPIGTTDMFDLVRPIVKDRKADLGTLMTAYRIFVKGGSPKLKAHFEAKLSSTDINHRAAAVHFIGAVKGRAALADLYPLLTTGPKLIRMEAASAVGRLGQRESIAKLKVALDGARETDVKVNIIEALAAIKDADIIPVVRFLITDRDYEVRRAAIKALVGVAHERATGDLAIAMNDRKRDIREMALTALIELDPKAHFPEFKSALSWMPTDFVGRLVNEKKEAVLSHAKAALESRRPEMRSVAFRSLGALNKATQVELFETLARASRFPEQRLAAIDALVALEGKASRGVLEGLTKDSDEAVRVLAIATLGRLGDTASEALLIETMLDPKEKIRVAAAAALVRL
ncbi:MAG: HEAT repeat protein [Myxococcota bacterium]|jgi:HEAT repeat protein